MHTTRYNDYGSPARDFDELRLLMEAWDAEIVEQIKLSRHPETLMSQKSACAYVVYATTWGKGQKGYTGGYV